MDLVGNVDDGLDKSLVPLANRTSEGRARSSGSTLKSFNTCFLVEELTRST